MLATRRSSFARGAVALALPLLVGCGNVAELLGMILIDSGSGQVQEDEGGPPDAQPEAGLDAAGSDAGDGGDSGGPCDLTRPFGPPMLLTSLESTAATEGGLRLLPDELTGFFWSSRAGGPGSTNLYGTSRPDIGSPFGNIKLLANINSTMSLNIDPSSTADGLSLYFRVRSGKPDAGLDELYSANRQDAGGDFAGRAVLAELNSIPTSTVQPFVLSDGSEIYFSSNRAGNYDIYRAERSDAGFGAPSAVTELNMAGADEGDPVASSDDLTILFSSTRDGGLGGEDIWLAQREATGSPFSSVIDLREVNSGGTDAPTWISQDACRLYLSSDRDGAGHLYLATRP